ncbi:MAG: metallophosphoesterase [Phaeospirillum sp.]|nr:metallophosphoesterase [Phaeospirillum sp.]
MIDREHRQAWLKRRLQLEALLKTKQVRHTPQGTRPESSLGKMLSIVDWVFERAGPTARGRGNARSLHLTEQEFRFADLPPAFDGYTILFMSDFHVGELPENLHRGQALVSGLRYDMAVLGGDYQTDGQPSSAKVTELLAPLLAELRPPDGVFGILGNHDSHKMVEPLEALGLRLLLNESVEIVRGDQSIHLVGCDDVHIFYDHAARQALRQGGGFRVAVVHSPEFAQEAADSGCALYLAGHTHGGQICLPGGRPVITSLDRNHRLARGAWRLRGMQGYTSTGFGSGVPTMRFNCPPEVTLITLRRFP